MNKKNWSRWRCFVDKNRLDVDWKTARIDRRLFIRKHLEYGRLKLLFKVLAETYLVPKRKLTKIYYEMKNSI